jgi:hypothetical protein
MSNYLPLNKVQGLFQESISLIIHFFFQFAKYTLIQKLIIFLAVLSLLSIHHLHILDFISQAIA